MKTNDQQSQTDAKAKTVAKRNWRYQNDPEFREKMKTMSRERYWNDSVYREQTKERARKRAKEKYHLEKRKSTDTVSQGTSSNEEMSSVMNLKRSCPDQNENSGEGPSSQQGSMYVAKADDFNTDNSSDEHGNPSQFTNSLIFARKSGI